MGEIPVDRGWAWLTVLGAAWCMFSVVASFKSQGLLFVEFVEHFEASSYLTAWMMGISACGMSLCSPAATYLAKRYSCRLVVFAGCCLSASAAFLASFATNIYFVICVYGGITGLGYALMYGPGLMLIGVYFNKRRTLANGLALSGASVGQLIIPLLMRHLIKHYGVFGALRVYSAFLLHGFVAAMLMRPPEYYTRRGASNNKSEESLVKDKTSENHLPIMSNKSNLCELNSTKLTHIDLSMTSSPMTTQGTDNRLDEGASSHISGQLDLSEYMANQNQEELNTRNSDRGDNLRLENRICSKYEKVSSGTNELTSKCSLVAAEGETNSDLKHSVSKKSQAKMTGSQDERFSAAVSEQVEGNKPMCLTNGAEIEESLKIENETETSDSTAQDLVIEEEHTTDKHPIQESDMLPVLPVNNCESQENQEENSLLSSSSHTKDISKSYSRENKDLSDDLSHQSETDLVFVDNSSPAAANLRCQDVPGLRTCFKLYRWDHLTNTLFLIYVGACAIGNSAYVDHSMLIPPYAKSINIDKDTAAWLLATVGIGDFIGRIAGGWFADFKFVKRSVQMSVAMMCIGATTLVCTCFPSLWSLGVLCVVLGLVGGTYISMYTVVLIDFLGLHLFPSAFGLMIMFQGMFNTVLPSILGLLRDVTGTYQASFVLLGVLMVFSGSLLLWEPCARKHEQQRTNKGDPV